MIKLIEISNWITVVLFAFNWVKAHLHDFFQLESLSIFDFNPKLLIISGWNFPNFECSGASLGKYPLQPIKKISGISYYWTREVIVLIEFPKPAFCIKTNDGLLAKDIPVAIPIASSSLVAIIIDFFYIAW